MGEVPESSYQRVLPLVWGQAVVRKACAGGRSVRAVVTSSEAAVEELLGGVRRRHMCLVLEAHRFEAPAERSAERVGSVAPNGQAAAGHRPSRANVAMMTRPPTGTTAARESNPVAAMNDNDRSGRP